MTQDLQIPNRENVTRLHRLFLKTMVVCQRPLAGPLLFGSVIGGIPISAITIWTPHADEKTLWLITPFYALMTAAVAVSGSSNTWKYLLYRAFLSSFAGCVITPTIFWILWLRFVGHQAPDVHVVASAMAFSLWATIVLIPGWLLALAYIHLRRKRALQ